MTDGERVGTLRTYLQKHVYELLATVLLALVSGSGMLVADWLGLRGHPVAQRLHYENSDRFLAIFSVANYGQNPLTKKIDLTVVVNEKWQASATSPGFASGLKVVATGMGKLERSPDEGNETTTFVVVPKTGGEAAMLDPRASFGVKLDSRQTISILPPDVRCNFGGAPMVISKEDDPIPNISSATLWEYVFYVSLFGFGASIGGLCILVFCQMCDKETTIESTCEKTKRHVITSITPLIAEVVEIAIADLKIGMTELIALAQREDLSADTKLAGFDASAVNSQSKIATQTLQKGKQSEISEPDNNDKSASKGPSRGAARKK